MKPTPCDYSVFDESELSITLSGHKVKWGRVTEDSVHRKE